MDLTGCGFLSSSCLSNSGCLGLFGLNLTDCAFASSGGAEHPASGGEGGDLVGLGGLVRGAGGVEHPASRVHGG